MAVPDEFDMDIGDADFNIEEDDDDYYVAPSHATDPDALANNPEDGNDDDVEMRAKFPHVTQRNNGSGLEPEAVLEVDGNARATTSPVEGDRIPEDYDYDDEMDDEFDALLTQIDESEFTKAAADRGEPQPIVIEQAPEELKLMSQEGNMPFARPAPSVAKDRSAAVASTKVPERSPLKRDLIKISDFFSSQEDANSTVPPKRHFPGPAGLLQNSKTTGVSKRTVCQTVLEDSQPKNSVGPQQVQSRKKHVSSLRQDESDILVSNAAWRSMVKVLDLNLKDSESLLHMMNIAWLKEIPKKVSRLVNIPLLILVVKADLQEVSSKGKTQNCVKFMDPSGTIVGALDQAVLKAYGDKIAPGTTVALRNSQILMYGRHILVSVLNNNVLCLTTSKEFEEDLLTPPSGDQFPSYKKDDSGIYILQRGPLVFDEVLEDYHKLLESLETVKNDKEVSEVSESIISGHSNGLFATVALNNNNESQTKGLEPPTRTVADPNNAFFSSEHAHANFTTDSSGFDDDDDEFLKALEGMDFDNEKDNL